MKRLLSITILLCTICTLAAQKNSPMRAYNLYYEKDFAKAKECIDQCLLDEKFSAKANTWLYKANIELSLAREEYSKKQENSNYEIRYPESPMNAYIAFKKAAEINKNIEASEMQAPYEALPTLYPFLFMEGINTLVANNFKETEPVLALAVESYEMQNPPQYPLKGELYYYYAYTLEMLGKDADAQTYYRKSIDDGSTNANVYARLIENYKKANQKEDMLALINKGKQTNPDDVNILVAEAEYYIWTGDSKRGMELLNRLPQSVYQSPDALVNAANLYIKQEAYQEAESMLKRAYALSPDNSIIVHNLGVCCSNIGEAKYLQANKLAIEKKDSESQQVKQEADKYMNDAAYYFEKALVSNPNDITLMQKLKEIYLRLSQNNKAKAMEDKINASK